MSSVIGVSAMYHDSAAAAVVGSDIVAAVQEERFSRRRHDQRLPTAALEYCIAKLGGVERVDAVAFYEDPVLAFDRVLCNSIDLAPASERQWPSIAASQFRSKLAVMERLQGLFSEKVRGNLFVVDHHISHAASAFYPSPFQEAAIIVVDGVGEWASTTIADAEGTTITPLKQIHYPHSLGLFYSAFTHHCGLKVNSGEYKLMGLAPYGTPRHVKLILDHLIDLREDGSFFLNTEYFGFLTGGRATNAAFEELVGSPRREPETALSRHYMDLAASAQAVIDLAVQGVARHALAATGRRNLCLAGGVALNCVTNGSLRRRLASLEGLWIQPAAGDAGGALGAALHVAHQHFQSERHAGVPHSDGQKGSLLGPTFTAAQIEPALARAGLAWHRVDDAMLHAEGVARELADGLIVGRFDGAMEFGPRALGNRSILADARRTDAQSHINRRIKFRESWRPFAPVILHDRVTDYFDLSDESPYMLLIAHLREDRRHDVDWSAFETGDDDLMKLVNQQRSSIPGVTHVDFSARIQTVDPVRNPAFHRLLRLFDDMTGCPVLINTSFNVRGEPIVCSPEDAVRCFLNTGIDVLAIGPYLVYKHEQAASIGAPVERMVHELD